MNLTDRTTKHAVSAARGSIDTARAKQVEANDAAAGALCRVLRAVWAITESYGLDAAKVEVVMVTEDDGEHISVDTPEFEDMDEDTRYKYLDDVQYLLDESMFIEVFDRMAPFRL